MKRQKIRKIILLMRPKYEDKMGQKIPQILFLGY